MAKKVFDTRDDTDRHNRKQAIPSARPACRKCGAQMQPGQADRLPEMPRVRAQRDERSRMMDAPKRIWAWLDEDWTRDGSWSSLHQGPRDASKAEYLLAAEHDRLMAEKDAENERLREALRRIDEASNTT